MSSTVAVMVQSGSTQSGGAERADACRPPRQIVNDMDGGLE